MTSRTIALTSAALIGFAANSLLCRAALGPNAIDPATFTFVRLASGAIVLWLLARRKDRALAPEGVRARAYGSACCSRPSGSLHSRCRARPA